MVTRQEQRERRRQEILGEALRLFVRKGYAATKVSDIAEAVGMSTGLMFHYFDSKEKLYEELVKLGVEGPMGMVGAMAAEGDALSFFEGAAAGIMGFLRDEPAMADMFVLMGNALMDDACPRARARCSPASTCTRRRPRSCAAGSARAPSARATPWRFRSPSGAPSKVSRKNWRSTRTCRVPTAHGSSTS